jgi:hypothetical protein
MDYPSLSQLRHTPLLGSRTSLKSALRCYAMCSKGSDRNDTMFACSIYSRLENSTASLKRGTCYVVAPAGPFEDYAA